MVCSLIKENVIEDRWGRGRGRGRGGEREREREREREKRDMTEENAAACWGMHIVKKVQGAGNVCVLKHFSACYQACLVV